MRKAIEDYAWGIILNGAQSAIDTDMDEDGDLNSESEWLAALRLAQRILDEVERTSDRVMKVVRFG